MPAGFVKTVICFANSRKMSGRCFAGKEMNGTRVGRWIRPVSERPCGELNKVERCYNDGREPAPLDLVTMTLVGPRPQGYQTENYLIDTDYYWVRKRRASWDEVEESLDFVTGELWLNSWSSRHGLRDRIPEREASALPGSLKLVKVTDLGISVAIEGAEFGNGKQRSRANFSLNGIHYRLSLTDPNWTPPRFGCAPGYYRIGSAILCISLGELYQGYTYKLAATMVPLEIAQAKKVGCFEARTGGDK